MNEATGSMSLKERHEQVEGYLGKVVTIDIDRPIGYVHTKGEKTLVYPINYGYIPGVFGGDGEELDVYLLGVDVPVSSYVGQIIVSFIALTMLRTSLLWHLSAQAILPMR